MHDHWHTTTVWFAYLDNGGGCVGSLCCPPWNVTDLLLEFNCMNEIPESHTAKLSDDRTIQPFDATVQEALAMARDYALVQGYLDVRSIHLVVEIGRAHV